MFTPEPEQVSKLLKSRPISEVPAAIAPAPQGFTGQGHLAQGIIALSNEGLTHDGMTVAKDSNPLSIDSTPHIAVDIK